jgi:hypothetical protein
VNEIGKMNAPSLYLPSQAKMESIKSNSPVKNYLVPAISVCSLQRAQAISPLFINDAAGNKGSNGFGKSFLQ